MTTAINTAIYFLSRADRESGDAPTHLWLQKQVFYAQVWSLVFLGRTLFDEPVEAWANGPVVRSVWEQFKRYERDVIPEYPIDLESFTSDELQVLDAVWEIYGDLAASKLWKLTHAELPWGNARVGLELGDKSSNIIPIDDMQAYYAHFGGVTSTGEFFIDPKVTNCDKDTIFVTVGLQDGTKVKLHLNNLAQFVMEHQDLIQYERSHLPEEGVELF